jgi:hypothetical protein
MPEGCSSGMGDTLSWRSWRNGVLPRCCPAARIRSRGDREAPAQPVGSGMGRLRRGAGTFCNEAGHLAVLQPTLRRRLDDDVGDGLPDNGQYRKLRHEDITSCAAETSSKEIAGDS